ncbi:2-dehydro-3-deoxy-D-gluconate 5-dehydrogenase [bacterium HR29]|jgi:NAD(P)-dependent dehydrogenase (short-subunit alcohol dehydrogenase family)|nr:2-dehydro-3-deoxy-D-gluconate 5-dehydrogenase [bacterium HR29]
MGHLDGKVALVTGAASGNGRAMAVRFARDGADVAIADIDTAGLEETARLVRQQERRVLAVECDVAKKEDIDRLVAETVRTFGGLHIAVANAGVVERETDCFTMTEEQWDRTISVNLKGVFFTLQAAANQMRAQGTGGRLIAIASIMAEWGSAGTPAYCASKGGVKQLVRSFALACAPYGITCNAIGPGFIETQMTAPLREFPPLAQYLIDRTPVGRIGTPEDVAAVASFLASDEASFVTGTIVFPDGGITAGLYSRALAMAREQAAQGRS